MNSSSRSLKTVPASQSITNKRTRSRYFEFNIIHLRPTLTLLHIGLRSVAVKTIPTASHIRSGQQLVMLGSNRFITAVIFVTGFVRPAVLQVDRWPSLIAVIVSADPYERAASFVVPSRLHLDGRVLRFGRFSDTDEGAGPL